MPNELLLERPPTHSHLVQFYGLDEAMLTQNVSQYVAEGLGRGDHVLIVATVDRIGRLTRQLQALSADPEGAASHGRLLRLNADQALDTFFRDGKPSGEAFDANIGSIVRRMAAAARPYALRVYGEMVDVLWKRQEIEAAIEVEDLWNVLLRSCDFSLFCGYGIDVLSDTFQNPSVRAFINAHTHCLAGGKSPTLQSSIEAALAEAFGVRAAEVKRRLDAECALASSGMSPHEAGILWLKENFPADIDRILALARANYAAASGGRQTRAFSGTA